LIRIQRIFQDFLLLSIDGFRFFQEKEEEEERERGGPKGHPSQRENNNIQ
jgi:hypothetical protein